MKVRIRAPCDSALCNDISCVMCMNSPLVGNILAVVEGNVPAEGGSVLGLAVHNNWHCRRIDSARVHRTTYLYRGW